MGEIRYMLKRKLGVVSQILLFSADNIICTVIISDIATKTDDQDLHLTIIDYEKDENLKKALYASSLSVDIISKIGDVNIAESILDAIKTQPNHNEIVMVVDPHVKFPLDIMDQARKVWKNRQRITQKIDLPVQGIENKQQYSTTFFGEPDHVEAAV